jgi:prohead serine protease
VVGGALNLQSPPGQTAYSDLKFGSVKGLSIGYDCLDGKYTYDQTGVRTLNEVRLFEISLVAIPANPMAQVTHVKSLEEAIGVVRAVASNSSDAATMKPLRELLKELEPIVIVEDDDGEAEKAAQTHLEELLAAVKRIASPEPSNMGGS